jgi:hypothetical protein
MKQNVYIYYREESEKKHKKIKENKREMPGEERIQYIYICIYMYEQRRKLPGI